MANVHFDVLVVGSPSVDLVFGGLPHWPIPGQEVYVPQFAMSAGAIFNTAAALCRLGLRVGLMCELGNDFFSRYMLEEIERAGISKDLIFLREYPLRSVSVCLPYGGERAFVSYADRPDHGSRPAGEELLAEQHDGGEAATHGFAPDMLEALKQVDCTAAFLYVHPAMRLVLDVLHQSAATIFLDAGWSLNNLNESSLADQARIGHYFMPNQAEATFITGLQDPEEAVRALVRLGPVPIVKVGARGVLAYWQGELLHCPALNIAEVVDTTGAGDAFNAGFIYGILRGYSFSDALHCGTICGSLSATAMTGTAAVPTVEQLESVRLQQG